MKKTTPSDAALLQQLEQAIKAILTDKDTRPGDRLKAVEIGAKLLAIKHKIEGSGDAGSYFGGN